MKIEEIILKINPNYDGNTRYRFEMSNGKEFIGNIRNEYDKYLDIWDTEYKKWYLLKKKYVVSISISSDNNKFG